MDDARFFYSQIQSYCNLFEKDEGVNATKLPIYLETNGSGEVRYRIKEGWRLHMYISQLPCKYKYTLFLSSLVVYWCVKNSLLTVLTFTWGLIYFFLIGGDASLSLPQSLRNVPFREEVVASSTDAFQPAGQTSSEASMKSNG